MSKNKMQALGSPILLDEHTVIQLARTATGEIQALRLAVCIKHDSCPVLFEDGIDCGPLFRWATATDLTRLQATKGAA